MFWIKGQRVIEKTFPDGEKNIWGFEVEGGRYSMTESPTLVWRWNSDADLITLMLLKKCYPNFKYLTIQFLPYGREDRDGQGGSNCSLRYIGEFIQTLGFDQITVYDPHSDLTLAYLGTKAKALYPNRLIRPFLRLSSLGEPVVGADDTIAMFPDAGAQKRYGKLWGMFPQIVGNKTRDFKTGKITGYSISGGELARGKRVVIVDDLCAYGGTFMAAGDALRPFGPAKVVLVVTHCEDSIFQGKLFSADSPIDQIITTDSLVSSDPGDHHLSAAWPERSFHVIALDKTE